jgi:hypothetical protein
VGVVTARGHVCDHTLGKYEQNMEGFDLVLDAEMLKRLSDASGWAR